MYSPDFRKAALKHYDGTHEFRKTCSIFKISQSTLSSWLQKRKEGTVLCSGYRGRKPVVDRDKVRAYVDEHPDAYQREIAEAFGCSQPCICAILQGLHYTFKKKQSTMQSRTM